LHWILHEKAIGMNSHSGSNGSSCCGKELFSF